ncbi:MAG TPA: PKD domain-containing protein, partial [Candidatus Hydrogenedentes bacterium]|nr:PKD domain-containing protein [Candidatus Hydrogenedentota bacterium]
RYPDKVCGTLLVAAGWPTGTSLWPSTDRLVVQILIGEDDENYTYDIPQTQGRLVDAGIRCVVTPFPGGHVWPSAQTTQAGCRWLNANAEKDPNSGLTPQACRPSSLFCQAPPPTGGAWAAKVVDSEYNWTAFERFDGATLPVATLEWWGISAVWNSNTGYWLPSGPGSRTFRISLHPDNAGAPGPSVHAETVTVSREDLPHLYSRNYALRRFRAVLSAPVNLSSGWVGIQHARTGDAMELIMCSYEGDGQYLHSDGAAGTLVPAEDDLAIAVGPEEMEVEIFAQKNFGHPPLRVQFGAGVSGNVGPVVNWRWDFGDGDILEGVEPAPAHVYSDTGVYSVSLTVSTDLSSAIAERRDLIVVSEALPLAGPAGGMALLAAILSLGAVLLGRFRRGA